MLCVILECVILLSGIMLGHSNICYHARCRSAKYYCAEFNSVGCCTEECHSPECRGASNIASHVVNASYCMVNEKAENNQCYDLETKTYSFVETLFSL
jgi:hypothetical protein